MSHNLASLTHFHTIAVGKLQENLAMLMVFDGSWRLTDDDSRIISKSCANDFANCMTRTKIVIALYVVEVNELVFLESFIYGVDKCFVCGSEDLWIARVD